MRRPARAPLSLLAVTALVFTAAGCSGESRDAARDKAADRLTEEVDRAVDETYQVTYEVTGESVFTVEFNAGRGTATEPDLDSVDEPKTPWSKTVTLKGIAAPTLLAVPEADGSGATCRITYKGEVLEERTTKGDAPASCVALSPLAR
ncbi:MmpS family transport accessory protein [Streptomyces zingiberis]|uniref:MmpS family membrane protein n=1 Tax=Streptomyces zingiberis TaxID=2053010 RepID=A0ABX1BSK3_9ACTN|nr:MmpS family transport accessory protein [Streptomyces zingiberis]NJQ00691.1 hypothetical protein [Streptomyces zingiberis]